MRSRSLLYLLLALALPARAPAFIGGITGFSGIVRPDGGAPLCNKCHGGGEEPNVRLEGPPEVQPNETATFQFVIESLNPAQKAGGLDVAASGGQLGILPEEGEQVVEGELTHIAPRPGTEGTVAWRFLWTAPRAPGSYTLYAAGNSVNGDAHAGGDLAARTSLGVVVAGETFTPAPTGTATPTPTPSPTRSSTPTRTAPPCGGDCNRDGRVMVDELIHGVHASLGTAPLEDCTAFDPNGDRTVSLNELVGAVDHALGGCD